MYYPDTFGVSRLDVWDSGRYGMRDNRLNALAGVEIGEMGDDDDLSLSGPDLGAYTTPGVGALIDPTRPVTAPVSSAPQLGGIADMLTAKDPLIGIPYLLWVSGVGVALYMSGKI